MLIEVSIAIISFLVSIKPIDIHNESRENQVFIDSDLFDVRSTIGKQLNKFHLLVIKNIKMLITNLLKHLRAIIEYY